MRHARFLAVGLGLTSTLASCNNFLDATKAVADPNAPTAASINQLFVAIEANIFGQQEGPIAMLICEWVQQCAGTAGRFVEVQGTYTITNNSLLSANDNVPLSGR